MRFNLGWYQRWNKLNYCDFVPTLLLSLIDQLHPIELSAEMHERLATIHPFIDGNGRTSRLLMNLILLQNGFPIAILKGDTESRLKNYGALETAQTENSKQPFIDFIKENVGKQWKGL